MSDEMENKFNEMGARVQVSLATISRQERRQWNGRSTLLMPTPEPIRVDVKRDEDGEYFDVRHAREVKVRVIDVRPNDRHLLLTARLPASRFEDSTVCRFLCGHDERAWFVAAIPETAPAETVDAAKDALKPEAVWEAIHEHGVPLDKRNQRRTTAFVRQGEWFFIPRPEVKFHFPKVLRNEPIRRGAGKPHLCQFLARIGGERVHVNGQYANGITDAEFNAVPRLERERWDWRTMTRDARVFARGKFSHPDHATIHLGFWHEVVMNTETRARAMQHVAFLD